MRAVKGEIGGWGHETILNSTSAKTFSALPPLPRRKDLDPIAVFHRRCLARARRHELAVERGRDLGLAVVERLQGFRKTRGGDFARLATRNIKDFERLGIELVNPWVQ